LLDNIVQKIKLIKVNLDVVSSHSNTINIATHYDTGMLLDQHLKFKFKTYENLTTACFALTSSSSEDLI